MLKKLELQMRRGRTSVKPLKRGVQRDTGDSVESGRKSVRRLRYCKKILVNRKLVLNFKISKFHVLKRLLSNEKLY